VQRNSGKHFQESDMGLISDFIRRKEIDALAKRLSEQFAEKLPPVRLKDAKRFTQEFEIILGHIQGFQRKEHLGTFGKARLINNFQWALLEKGYDKELTQQLANDIATRLTPKRPNQPGGDAANS
jgi:hypothetical protein